jgi:hypothetical protein
MTRTLENVDVTVGAIIAYIKVPLRFA